MSTIALLPFLAKYIFGPILKIKTTLQKYIYYFFSSWVQGILKSLYKYTSFVFVGFFTLFVIVMHRLNITNYVLKGV